MEYAGPNTTMAGNGRTTSAPIGYNNPVADRSSSPARDQISGAEQYLSDLHGALDRLEQRLDTILTPIPPDSGKTSGAAPAPPQSHVVGRLQLLNEGFSHLASRIERLNARVEL